MEYEQVPKGKTAESIRCYIECFVEVVNWALYNQHSHQHKAFMHELSRPIFEFSNALWNSTQQVEKLLLKLKLLFELNS